MGRIRVRLFKVAANFAIRQCLLEFGNLSLGEAAAEESFGFYVGLDEFAQDGVEIPISFARKPSVNCRIKPIAW